MSSAANKRYRRRQRNGLVVLPVEVDEVAVTEALIVAGYLDPRHADDRAAQAKALAAAIKAWNVLPPE